MDSLLEEKGLTNREVVAALNRERVSANQSVTTQAVRRCYVKYIQTAALKGEEDLEGRPFAPLPFCKRSKI